MVSGGEKEKKENMWSGEKEKNREGKGENILGRKKQRKKEENIYIWRSEICGTWKRRGTKKPKIFGQRSRRETTEENILSRKTFGQ